MRKVTYIAVLEPNGSGGYGVYFPDLPGCISFGNDIEEAQKEAAEALGLHLYGMEKDGDEIPEPTLNPHLDDDATPGSLFVPVSVFPDVVRDEIDNRRVKTNVTIPAWLKDVAEERKVNYSRLLETALREYLNMPEGA